MTLVIEDAGEGDYTLLVTDDGHVEARKTIPHDGVRYYTTRSRELPTGERTQSQFDLDAGMVIEQYVTRTDTQTPRHELAGSVIQALDQAGPVTPTVQEDFER